MQKAWNEMDRNYSVTRFEKELSIDELLSTYFDFEKTHKLCSACSGYAQTWACPPFDFEPEDFFRQYSVFRLIVDRIDNAGAADVDEAQQRLFTEKDRYDQEMLDLEKSIPGSYGLAAQECVQCKKCARLSGHPCVHPDKMRYSLEAIGCFPVELVHDKFGFDILWSDGESIPEYYLLVAGVLKK